MSEQDAYQEAVFLFDGDKIVSEMHFSEFDALLDRAASVGKFVDTRVKAAYVVVGTGLAVRGMVCFFLPVDTDGYADTSFSVPLRQLVKVAGPGPDVGCGRIRLACASQCEPPTQAPCLWDPRGKGESSEIRLIQQAVWRNRLGIRVPEGDKAATDAPRKSGSTEGIRQALEAQFDEAFGAARKVSLQQVILHHKKQVEALRQRFRLDLEQQQQIYLDQINRVHEELSHLKRELREEQARNQMLQRLLRGEVGS